MANMNDLKKILEHRNGFAFGESHKFPDIAKSITKDLAKLKSMGVDTIYLEATPEDISVFKGPKSGIEELKQRLKEIRDNPKDPDRESMEKKVKEFYGDKITLKEFMNYNIARCDLALEAKKQGVRLEGMDGTEEQTKSDVSKGTRVESANHKWVQEIKRDRKEIDPQGHGKYIVIGGLRHFTNDGTVAKQLNLEYGSTLKDTNFYNGLIQQNNSNAEKHSSGNDMDNARTQAEKHAEKLRDKISDVKDDDNHSKKTDNHHHSSSKGGGRGH